MKKYQVGKINIYKNEGRMLLLCRKWLLRKCTIFKKIFTIPWYFEFNIFVCPKEKFEKYKIKKDWELS